MKKKIKITIIVLSAMFFIVAVVVAGFMLKPDWKFIVADYCERMIDTDKSQLTEINAQTVEYTLTELHNDNRVVFDQSAMLINAAHTLPNNFEADLSPYKDTEVLMNTCVSDAYARLVADIVDKYDNKLYIMSAYRTAEEQQQVSEDEHEAAAAFNASEHVAGLALDVYVMYHAGYGFIKSEVGQYVNSECYKYGFIIRYPYYGEKSTAIGYEPWHIRYVGEPHARIIYENGLTYEEYIESIEPGKVYSCGDYTVSRQSGDTLYLPANITGAVISPDNTGYYLICCK